MTAVLYRRWTVSGDTTGSEAKFSAYVPERWIDCETWVSVPYLDKTMRNPTASPSWVVAPKDHVIQRCHPLVFSSCIEPRFLCFFKWKESGECQGR